MSRSHISVILDRTGSMQPIREDVVGGFNAFLAEQQAAPDPATFTLVQFYETDPPIAHFDLYRLERPEEAREIGLDEALDVGAALIEWPVRLGEDLARVLGPDRLTISFSEEGSGRDATVSGVGAWAMKIERLVEGWND